MKRGTKAACSAALVAVMLAGGCLLQACSQQSAPADLPKTESRTASREEASSAGAVPEKGEPEEPALKGINDLTGMPMEDVYKRQSYGCTNQSKQGYQETGKNSVSHPLVSSG